MTRSSLLAGIFVALLFTGTLNIGTFGAMRSRGPDMASMGTSVDEAYYFALIRDGSTGYGNLGNASLKEHRFDRTTSGAAPLMQGSLMRLFGWDIETTVAFGDLFFPFLFAFLLFCTLQGLLASVPACACATLFIGSASIGLLLLRSISPQITIIFFIAYLAAYLSVRRSTFQYVLRGLLIAALLYVHIIYAGLLLFIEALDLLSVLCAGKQPLARVISNACIAAVLVMIAAGLKFFLISTVADAPASEDTYRRMGVIATHAPANPAVQLAVFMALGMLFFVRRKQHSATRQIDLFVLLLLAGLLALNQSVLHGVDINFGLYYALPIRILLWISWFFIVWTMISLPTVRLSLGFILAVTSTVSLLQTAAADFKDQQRQRQAFEHSDVPSVLEFLGTLPPERVILAPYPIADLVPVFTDHYVAFNRYSRYQSARDSELADRYLLQEALFPSPIPKDDTYNLVFGLSAGNLSAKQRTACRVWSLFLLSDAQCRRSIRDSIFHQDVLRKLDEKKVDVVRLLKDFSVDVIVTPSVLSGDILHLCPKKKSVGAYFIHECRVF